MCGVDSDDVETSIDPMMTWINGNCRPITLCNDCYDYRVEESRKL